MELTEKKFAELTEKAKTEVVEINGVEYGPKGYKAEEEIARGKAPSGRDCVAYVVRTASPYAKCAGYEIVKQLRTVDVDSGKDMVFNWDKAEAILGMIG